MDIKPTLESNKSSDRVKLRIYNPCPPIPIHKIKVLDDNTNRLGVMGAEIFSEMNNKLRKKNYLLPFLTGLRMDYGWRLDKKLELNTKGIGDSGYLFAVNEKGETEMKCSHYLKRFRIINEDGFWQMYLLYHSWSVMPAYWHGLYGLRGYVFSLSDIRYIENMYDSDKEIFSKNKELLPRIDVRKNFADIVATYWDDQEGLCRETVRIIVDDDGRMISIKRTGREVLVEPHIFFCY